MEINHKNTKVTKIMIDLLHLTSKKIKTTNGN